MPPTTSANTPPRAAAYERTKERARARAAAESRSGRDIGAIPPVANSARKAAAFDDFRIFCETYFPERFTLAWSPDHLRVIAKIERAVLHGGQFAMAMPRGSGKTSLSECAVIWAVLTGAHLFVFLIGSCESHAEQMLANIKSQLQNNERLRADFPEALWPIHCLENQTRRAIGQLHHGRPTLIGWGADEVVMPHIPGSRASGAIIKVAGLTGNLRGAVHVRPDGRSVRPTLVICDDPQTDQSARSPSQCHYREKLIAGAVLGLAGPGKKIAAVMPCTVIAPGDMADNALDPSKHPEWHGERTRLLNSLPADEKLWEQYADIRVRSLQERGDISAATEFYRQNQPKLDEGAEAAWPARFRPDEASAVQHAMNLLLADEFAFWAEYQNQPKLDDLQETSELTVDQVAAKLNRHHRGLVPAASTTLTLFIDVQQKLLFYAVVAWEPNFSGAVIDYGSWPDQRRPYFTLRDARRTIAQQAPSAGLEGSIYHALAKLTDDLLGREWTRDDGTQMTIARGLIDANWGQSTDVVYQFCRESKHRALLMPSHGTFVGASSQPWDQYKRKPGEQIGHYWRIPSPHGKRAIRHVTFDANFWKSHVHKRLATAAGDPGSLSLFGEHAENHKLFAEHVTAEYAVEVTARGRTIEEWKLRPGRTENHWLDCLVGAAVAASMDGITLDQSSPVASRQNKPIKFSDLQRKQRERRRRR